MRCRLQREATGRRGTRTDPLYRGRRILLKTASLRTDRQKKRADELLGDPSNKPLALAHGVYQKIIACYAQEDRGKGRGMMAELIESLAVKGGAPGCPELLQRDAHTSQFAVHCVCSIESGPCERVDVFHVSGRFWSTSACGEKRTPARPAWTSFPS